MSTSKVYTRGSAKLSGIQKPKRPRCTLKSVRNTLMALRRIQISWHDPLLRLVYKSLKSAVNSKVDPSILLSHKLIRQKVKRLLICNLQLKYQPLINLLMPKIIQYQLSFIWIHITYFRTPPDELKLLLRSSAYNACWVCNRLHFPLGPGLHYNPITRKMECSTSRWIFCIFRFRRIWRKLMTYNYNLSELTRGNNFMNFHKNTI